MKKSVAMRWAKALRSGKYKQGKGVLHDNINNTYCCLGVLCEISGIADKKFTINGFTSYDGNSDILPESVRDWASIKSFSGDHVTASGETRYLSSYNDGDYVDPATGQKRSATFLEIADWIEQNYHNL